MQTIDVNTLRSWLDIGRPVAILDVRTAADRAEWAIPGSIHVDAYAALKVNDPHALDAVDLPSDIPIVTVCGAGKISLVATEQLRARGFEAYSLAGGMRAWSLAWNTAELRVPNSVARVVQVRRTGKGCLSYLIGADDQAAVIDAALEPAIYQQRAEQHGWRITAVLDTHIHADHLSRSRALAEQTGATLYLPQQERVSFSHSPIGDDDTIAIGSARLRALRTPGHTAESTSYLLDDQALFTGDTLFLPGHTSAPIAFDGKPLATTLAQVYAQTALLQVAEDGFVAGVLARIPPTPPNHTQITELNEAGALADDPIALEAGANRCAIA